MGHGCDDVILSVVIPVYNEGTRGIEETIAATVDYLESQRDPYELIIVDDGSTDDTGERVGCSIGTRPRARLIAYQPNRGKGYAVRTGILASAGKQVLFMDADQSTPIAEVEKGLRCLEGGADLAIASRWIAGAHIRQAQPRFRRVAKKLFQTYYRLVLGLKGFEDTQCGFKVFRGDVARRLFAALKIERFLFDLELLYLATHLGYRVAKFPVVWTNDPDSRVRPVMDLWRVFRDTIRIRLRGVPTSLR